MGLFEAKGQLDRGMKDLLIRWSLARSQWKDNVAAEFENQQLVPLQCAPAERDDGDVDGRGADLAGEV